MTVHIIDEKNPVVMRHRSSKLTAGKMRHIRTEKHHGKMIEVVEKVVGARKRNRDTFQPEFTQLPAQWVNALRKIRNERAWNLAVTILDEQFRLKRRGKTEITLSGNVTNMASATKMRIARKFEQHGLIRIIPTGEKQALRIIMTQEKRKK